MKEKGVTFVEIILAALIILMISALPFNVGRNKSQSKINELENTILQLKDQNAQLEMYALEYEGRLSNILNSVEEDQYTAIRMYVCYENALEMGYLALTEEGKKRHQEILKSKKGDN